MNFIITSLGSDWQQILNVFNTFFGRKRKHHVLWNKVITDISINKYIQFLTNTTYKILVDLCYKMLKA